MIFLHVSFSHFSIFPFLHFSLFFFSLFPVLIIFHFLVCSKSVFLLASISSRFVVTLLEKNLSLVGATPLRPLLHFFTFIF